LCLFVDRLDPQATINEQFLTLLPDEKYPFQFQSERELRLEQLTSPPVLQCVNRFGGSDL
jgi:beta-mannosidase